MLVEAGGSILWTFVNFPCSWGQWHCSLLALDCVTLFCGAIPCSPGAAVVGSLSAGTSHLGTMLKCRAAGYAARKGFFWPGLVITPFWLLRLLTCVFGASSSYWLLCKHALSYAVYRPPRWGRCQDVVTFSGSPGLPWRCLPATEDQLHVSVGSSRLVSLERLYFITFQIYFW